MVFTAGHRGYICSEKRHREKPCSLGTSALIYSASITLNDNNFFNCMQIYGKIHTFLKYHKIINISNLLHLCIGIPLGRPTKLYYTSCYCGERNNDPIMK